MNLISKLAGSGTRRGRRGSGLLLCFGQAAWQRWGATHVENIWDVSVFLVPLQALILG
jgi:hypothetical protein